MGISTESISLTNVSVRCVTHPNEKKRWNELMKTHHYLPYHGLIGRSVRHVAEYEGEWLALIGWQGGAFKIGPRDQWIGWCPDYQYQRLHLIAQNARFLVLHRIPKGTLHNKVSSLSVRCYGIIPLTMKLIRSDINLFHLLFAYLYSFLVYFFI